eukprot:4088188-Pyramimonas_sp.AAC.1
MALGLSFLEVAQQPRVERRAEKTVEHKQQRSRPLVAREVWAPREVGLQLVGPSQSEPRRTRVATLLMAFVSQT